MKAVREYYNNDDGVIAVGETVWIRNSEGSYIERYLITDEYSNMYKAQDLDSALICYLTKDTFKVVNGELNKKSKGGLVKKWLQKRRGGNAPLKTKTVASDNPIQPAGSNTGPVKTTTTKSYVNGGGYGSTYSTTGKYGGSYGGYSAWGSKADCHHGNTIIATRETVRGPFTLMIGGWSRGAHTTEGMSVIDLTGFGKGHTDKGANFYNLKVTDYGTPLWDTFFWKQLADLVYYHLETGNVLITCQGGHGRSGMVSAVIAGLIQDKRDVTLLDGKRYFSDPIGWIRKVHCNHAVETYEQEKLVLETLMHFYPTSVRLANAWMELKPAKRIKSKGKAYKPVDKPAVKATEKNTTKVGDTITDLEKWVRDDEDWLDEWAEKEFKSRMEADSKPLCPICLTPADSISEAVMCCNSKGHNQFCPMCGTWNQTPKFALECCAKYNTGLV